MFSVETSQHHLGTTKKGTSLTLRLFPPPLAPNQPKPAKPQTPEVEGASDVSEEELVLPSLALLQVTAPVAVVVSCSRVPASACGREERAQRLAACTVGAGAGVERSGGQAHHAVGGMRAQWIRARDTHAHTTYTHTSRCTHTHTHTHTRRRTLSCAMVSGL